MIHWVPWRRLQLLPPLPLRSSRAGGRLAGAPGTVQLQVGHLSERDVQSTLCSKSTSRKVTRHLSAGQVQKRKASHSVILHCRKKRGCAYRHRDIGPRSTGEHADATCGR